MTNYKPTAVRDLRPGARFLLGCVIVSVVQVTLGLDLVLLRTTTGAVLRLPPCMQVDATLPDGAEGWCRRCETGRDVEGECRCHASAIGAMRMRA